MGTEPTADTAKIEEAHRVMERVKKALAGHQNGFRGPDGGQPLVELLAADVRMLCELANEETEIVKAQTKGCAMFPSELAGKQGRRVVIQADDAFHLLDNAE